MVSIVDDEEINLHQEPVQIRDDLVKTAVDFLRIPKVAGSSVEKKKNFLRSKGLNEEEIVLAFNQSGFSSSPDFDSFNEIYLSQKSSGWSSLVKFSFSTVFLSGICYGGYQLFKRYIQPRILRYFSDRLDSIERKLDNMMDTVKKLENETSSDKLQQNIQMVMMKTTRPNVAEIHAINELKTEISSVKALILSKNSIAVKPAADASIPAWQLDESTIRDTKSTEMSEDYTSD
ncbi:peroxisomal membrane protein PEX14-like [Panonychus citri]|uniref:peroxisomal membrane protein PEX14-like n=1 Tax=Panonychus citri TaxID=50023 RepID=UPI0023080C8F|nr:peroxisomal membrane protein PEX14-like [Panonychus citri]